LIILGIDPGLARTGWGVIERSHGHDRVVAYGCIETDKGESEALRLHDLFRQLAAIGKEQKPDVAAVEKLFFEKNVKTAMMVGQARGVVMVTLTWLGVPVREFTPLQVKLAVAGYGAATKEQVQRMVKTLLKLSDIPKPDDAADALAVALACR
jgi:crossover junction endodeoxyribonuclease RuvC